MEWRKRDKGHCRVAIYLEELDQVWVMSRAIKNDGDIVFMLIDCADDIAKKVVAVENLRQLYRLLSW